MSSVWHFHSSAGWASNCAVYGPCESNQLLINGNVLIFEEAKVNQICNEGQMLTEIDENSA